MKDLILATDQGCKTPRAEQYNPEILDNRSGHGPTGGCINNTGTQCSMLFSFTIRVAEVFLLYN